MTALPGRQVVTGSSAGRHQLSLRVQDGNSRGGNDVSCVHFSLILSALAGLPVSLQLERKPLS